MNKNRKIVTSILELIEIMSMSIVVVILVFTFIGRLSTVDGSSMNNTLTDGDRVIITNLFYTPQNGDIIVFQQADGYYKIPLVKRVIAKGGDTLRIDFSSWKVYVNGELVDEPYVNKDMFNSMKSEDYFSVYKQYLDVTGTMTIPEGYVFAMGDNRNHSSDSRYEGVKLVSVNDIMGKLILRIAPISEFGKVD
ncbi:MAG: signal peptidase I [Clostridia bacterium]|nr:signal peptidase I [Clostridia bacterium]